MKYRIRLLAYSFAATLMLFFSSCEREDAIKPSASNKKLQTTSVTVTGSKLEQKLQNTVVIGLLDLSENQYFRGMVHELVADTFDGDYNTLVKPLKLHGMQKVEIFLMILMLH